jgi:biotin carboxyl carrier protein
MVTACEFPAEEHITSLVAARAGGAVSPYYDSMVAQVIAHGRDRAEAIARLAAYLGRVRLHGVGSNLALLRAVLRDGVYRSGDYDTAYLVGLLQRLDVAALLAETAADAAVTPAIPDRARLAIPGSDELRVLAAQAGIFYRAPSPGEPDLAQEGEVIARDRAFGLLEVMKTFTPLTLAGLGGGAEALYPAPAYRVVSIGAVSGQQVNPGDLLMIVRPVV